MNSMGKAHLKTEIFSIVQHREVDALAPGHGVATFTLMEVAGAAVAKAITERWRPRPAIALC